MIMYHRNMHLCVCICLYLYVYGMYVCFECILYVCVCIVCISMYMIVYETLANTDTYRYKQYIHICTYAHGGLDMHTYAHDVYECILAPDTYNTYMHFYIHTHMHMQVH